MQLTPHAPDPNRHFPDLPLRGDGRLRREFGHIRPNRAEVGHMSTKSDAIPTSIGQVWPGFRAPPRNAAATTWVAGSERRSGQVDAHQNLGWEWHGVGRVARQRLERVPSRKTTDLAEVCAPSHKLLRGARRTVSIQCEVVSSVSAPLREDGSFRHAQAFVRVEYLGLGRPEIGKTPHGSPSPGTPPRPGGACWRVRVGHTCPYQLCMLPSMCVQKDGSAQFSRTRPTTCLPSPILRDPILFVFLPAFNHPTCPTLLHGMERVEALATTVS